MADEVNVMSALEKQLQELELKLSEVRARAIAPGVIDRLAAFSSGSCTNECTAACTIGCTKGCTGACAAESPVAQPTVTARRAEVSDAAAEGVAMFRTLRGEGSR